MGATQGEFQNTNYARRRSSGTFPDVGSIPTASTDNHSRSFRFDLGWQNHWQKPAGKRPVFRVCQWQNEVVGFGTRSKTTEAPASGASRKVAGPCNRTWAELMRRGLEIDVLQCPDCGGRMRFETRRLNVLSAGCMEQGGQYFSVIVGSALKKAIRSKSSSSLARSRKLTIGVPLRPVTSVR